MGGRDCCHVSSLIPDMQGSPVSGPISGRHRYFFLTVCMGANWCGLSFITIALPS